MSFDIKSQMITISFKLNCEPKPMTETNSRIKPSNFSIGEAAIAKISEVLSKEDGKKMFRIAVNGGGCSGFQYEFIIDDKDTPNDIHFGTEEARIVIDELSLSFLDNGSLEWSEELIGSSFKIKNPNARTSCGCGMSFSV